MTSQQDNAAANAQGRAGLEVWEKAQRRQCELRIKNATPETIANDMLMMASPGAAYKTNYILGITQQRANRAAGKV